MQIEHKAVGVAGVQHIEDQGEGLVRAFVSVTGLKDNVNDIIEPGAYADSLKVRKPKGVWHHDWKKSVSRTEGIKELPPGSEELPKTLPDGKPWPSNAGALRVDTRFNLKTQRGREAYEDVLFFGEDQEWSIGYNVPVGGATKDSNGIRHIKKLDLYEYSPVLFGAMPIARTSSVKEAQTAWTEIKSLHGDEAHNFLMEVKSFLGDDAFEFKGGNPEEDEDEEVDDKTPQGLPGNGPGQDDEDWDEEEDEEDPKKTEKSATLSAANADAVRQAIKSLQALLPDHDLILQEKSYEQKDLLDMLMDLNVEDDELLQKAADFEASAEALDLKAMEDAAVPILDFVEAMIQFGTEDSDEAKEVAAYIGTELQEAQGDPVDAEVEEPSEEDIKTIEIDGVQVKMRSLKDGSLVPLDRGKGDKRKKATVEVIPNETHKVKDGEPEDIEKKTIPLAVLKEYMGG